MQWVSCIKSLLKWVSCNKSLSDSSSNTRGAAATYSSMLIDNSFGCTLPLLVELLPDPLWILVVAGIDRCGQVPAHMRTPH